MRNKKIVVLRTTVPSLVCTVKGTLFFLNILHKYIEYWFWELRLYTLYIQYSAYIYLYISTHTKLVLWIYHAYYHQLTQNNHLTWTHIPVIHFFKPESYPLIPLTKTYWYTESKCFHDQWMKKNIFFLFFGHWSEHYFIGNWSREWIFNL